MFYELQGKIDIFAWLNDEESIVCIAYLFDILEQLNKQNVQMQKWNTSILEFVDSMKT